MRRLLISAVVISALPLSGCAVAELGHLAYLAANGQLAPDMNSGQQIKPVEGQQVYGASFFTPNKNGAKCYVDGVVVDYARDWDVIDDRTGHVVFKADPTKTYGQAVLMYHKECDDGTKSDVLLTDDRRQLIGKPAKLELLEGIHSTDYYTATEFQKPRWMAQVLKTIQTEAPTNPAARKFLEHVQTENGMPVARATEADIAPTNKADEAKQ
jgi:hypothetical protein